MEALLISTGIVALAEMGDKTQLLAFLLAARFKKPLPIIAGILCATVVNHGLAGALGAWITASLSPEILRWVFDVRHRCGPVRRAGGGHAFGGGGELGLVAVWRKL